ncbi:hypothetical protein [Tautonia plasticadhaerens]|uniref:Leucine Rich repeats (2 copies) n=1 Tax=Tautonia plasticadhaerens TaxID=2527974 RepID=A0A518HD45_9BACT|nr:hypothetical protein [Tautonia plasticadhaerens]QDV38789.1 hypothetical protein ElP_67460 [Tautonia plasticadhaerens]
MTPRRLRFSVRKGMALILVLGCTLGWIVHRADRQRDAVKAIERAGGEVLYDWQYRDGTMRSGGTPGGPAWLARILGPHYFDTVTHVTLPARTTDADMGTVAALGWVERLILDPSGLSDAGLAQLDRMTGLRWLVIDHRAIDVDSRIMPLRAISRLHGLTLAGTDVSDAGVMRLPIPGRLGLLDLEKTRVTDAGLAHIGGMSGLEDLSVENTELGDQGLAHLRRLEKLRRLSVNRTDVSTPAVDAFRKRHPGVRIRDSN